VFRLPHQWEETNWMYKALAAEGPYDL